MEHIPLPTTIQSTPVAEIAHRSQIVVSPCYPGYGTTVGNALRRVLLSSLPGAAATALKIKGVDHEFSTIPGVKEDVVEVILNVKALRFRVHSDSPVELELSAKGKGIVTASAITKNSEVEVITVDAPIATLTDEKAELNMKITVQKGRGYIPVEERENEKMDIGYIAIDAVYTPVRTVNYKTEHVRVGQMTNYDKLILDVSTDGTVSPEDAFAQAANILVDQFQALQRGFTNEQQEQSAPVESETSPETPVEEVPETTEESPDSKD